MRIDKFMSKLSNVGVVETHQGLLMVSYLLLRAFPCTSLC